MAETIGELNYKIGVNDTEFKKGMDSASEKFGGLKGSLDKAETASKAFGLGLAAIGTAAVGFGIKAFNAFSESNEGLVKLQTNLLAVKGNTQANVDELNNYATALQKKGVVEGDAIVAGMSQLATFNLQAKTIQTVTGKITDMAAQMGGYNVTAEQMTTLNNLAGKVLTGNVGALTRYGVTLSDAQAKLMAEGNETERANLLVQVLSQNYGKVNEALRATPMGQLTAFKQSFGDLIENIGGGVAKIVAPALGKVAEFFNKLASINDPLQMIIDKLKFLQPYLPIIAGAIVGALTPALVGMAIALWPVVAGLLASMVALLPWIAAGAAVALVIKLITNHFGGLHNTLQMLTPVWQFLGALFNTFIKPAFEQLWDVLKNQLWPALQELWNVLGPVLKPILIAIAVVIGGVLIGSLLLAAAVFRVIIAVVSTVISWFSYFIQGCAAIYSAVARYFNLYAIMDGAKNAIINAFRSAFDWVTSKVKSVKDALNSALNPFARHSPSLVDNVLSGTAIIKQQFEGLGKINVDPLTSRAPQLYSLPRTATNNTSQTLNFFGNINNTETKTLDDIGGTLARQLTLARNGVV